VQRRPSTVGLRIDVRLGLQQQPHYRLVSVLSRPRQWRLTIVLTETYSARVGFTYSL
jgi:hypothetical protein